MRGKAAWTAARWISKVLIVIVIAAGIWFALAWFRKDAGELSSGYRCAMNLKRIGVECLHHVEREGSGFFPHSPAGGFAALQLLADAPAGPKPNLFVCPASLEVPASLEPSGKYRLTAETCSYEIVPVKLSPTDSGFILAYERFPNHGGRHVLYTDTSIRFLVEDRFQLELEKVMKMPETTDQGSGTR